MYWISNYSDRAIQMRKEVKKLYTPRFPFSLNTINLPVRSFFFIWNHLIQHLFKFLKDPHPQSPQANNHLTKSVILSFLEYFSFQGFSLPHFPSVLSILHISFYSVSSCSQPLCKSLDHLYSLYASSVGKFYKSHKFTYHESVCVCVSTLVSPFHTSVLWGICWEGNLGQRVYP